MRDWKILFGIQDTFLGIIYGNWCIDIRFACLDYVAFASHKFEFVHKIKCFFIVINKTLKVAFVSLFRQTFGL